jgi:hypothetical protein
LAITDQQHDHEYGVTKEITRFHPAGESNIAIRLACRGIVVVAAGMPRITDEIGRVVADGAFTVVTANTWALGGEGLYSHPNWWVRRPGDRARPG